MGIILSNFKYSIINDIKTSISSNTAQYYAVASEPFVVNTNIENSDYSTTYLNDWSLLFGKKLKTTDINPVIRNIRWVSNTVYDRYDNNKDLSNSNFYVITDPDEVGGYYNVYKCIDNANGITSTYIPNQTQSSSFTLGDGYTWRYMYSISTINYNKFATIDYVPVYSNSNIIDNAYNYSGIEVINISNSGIGYSTYNNGKLQSISNSTLVQIEGTASQDNNFYTKNAIYIYSNNSAFPSQLRNIVSYTTGAQNLIYIDEPLDNVTDINNNINNTYYKISPRLLFDTDSDSPPKAYTIINSTSNSIGGIVIVDKGYGITRANVSVVSNTTYGYGANLSCVIPPAGGHGSNPENELLTNGLSIYFEFKGTESNNISINTSYNKIGIIKNPYSLNSNNTKGSYYSSNIFSQILEANISSGTYTNGEIVIGNTSSAKGIVVYSNSSVVHLIGDKKFSNGEYITNSNGNVSSQITINTLGDIYTKDLVPLYVRDVNTVTRANNQIEAFKLIIQV